MASTAQKSPDGVKLSPRETRLFNFMKNLGGEWVGTEPLVVSEYGSNRAKWPINAKTIVRVTMRSLQHKLVFHKARRRIETKGGGRGGVEFRLKY